VAERLEAYRRLLGGAVRSQLAYPTSFGLQLAGQGLAQGVDLLAILVLFGRVAAMGGFSRDEVLLIYGLASVGFGLADLAVGQLDRLPDLIRRGELDAMLLRPLSVLGQLCAADIALRRIGRVAAGALTLAYALLAVRVAWTPARVLLLNCLSAVGGGAPRRDLGGGHVGLLLGGGRPRACQQRDLRIQRVHQLPDHHLLRLGAPAAGLRGTRRVRGLLSRARPAGQA